MRPKFNVLIDTPPSTVSVGGREYGIDTDFRTVLSFLRLSADKVTPDTDKALFGLSLFYGDDIQEGDVRELLDFISFFVRRGEKEDDGAKEPHKKRIFDILEDSGRIYAAFMQIYGINLRKVKLHWWIFSELLDGLPKATRLSEVIEIRAKKPEKWMKPGEKNELARLQKYFKLEDDDADPIRGIFDSLAGIAT